MTRLIPLSWRQLVYARGALIFASALFLPLTLTGQTPPRTINDGAYSSAQAARGQQIYNAQCAACHGNQMEGTNGPPLAGEGFLFNWSAKSLSSLVDKIQKTMPFNLPASLTRGQATDLASYMLQAGKFPAAQVEPSEAALMQIVFPTVRATPARAAVNAGGTTLPPPEGNLAELMRAIAFPNANIIFNLQIKDPGAQAKKPPAATTFDYVEWGSTVYPGWLAVDQAAIAITETAPLLLTAGRRCQNGRPVPVDRPDWKQFVKDLVDAGQAAHVASRARKFEDFNDISDKLNDACANCHKVYRDKGGTEGSGATRCQP